MKKMFAVFTMVMALVFVMAGSLMAQTNLALTGVASQSSTYPTNEYGSYAA